MPLNVSSTSSKMKLRSNIKKKSFWLLLWSLFFFYIHLFYEWNKNVPCSMASLATSWQFAPERAKQLTFNPQQNNFIVTPGQSTTIQAAPPPTIIQYKEIKKEILTRKNTNRTRVKNIKRDAKRLFRWGGGRGQRGRLVISETALLAENSKFHQLYWLVIVHRLL